MLTTHLDDFLNFAWFSRRLALNVPDISPVRRVVTLSTLYSGSMISAQKLVDIRIEMKRSRSTVNFDTLDANTDVEVLFIA